MNYEEMVDVIYQTTDHEIDTPRSLHWHIGLGFMNKTGRAPAMRTDTQNATAAYEYDERDARRAIASVRLSQVVGQGTGHLASVSREAIRNIVDEAHTGWAFVHKRWDGWTESPDEIPEHAFGEAFIAIPCFVSALEPSTMFQQETGETAR
jgi:hypothetical protein